MSNRFGRAWVALTLALACHVVDEAATDFLSVYNPIVLDLRSRLGWFPMPTFTFGVWLAGPVRARGGSAAAVTARVSRCGIPARGRVPVHAAIMLLNGLRSPGRIGLPRPVDAGGDNRAPSPGRIDLALRRRARRQENVHRVAALNFASHMPNTTSGTTSKIGPIFGSRVYDLYLRA